MEENKKAWEVKKVRTKDGGEVSIITDSKGRPIIMQAFSFNELTRPNGFLDPHPGCQGLWYYCVLIKGQRLEELDPLQYDDVWPPRVTMSKELFTSIALMYGIAPEVMVKFWPHVDMQCTMMGSPKVHADLRHDKIPEIKTQ